MLKQWKSHGPFKVGDLIKNGNLKFNENLGVKTNMILGTQWNYSGQVNEKGTHPNSFTMRDEPGEMHGIGRDWNDGGMFEGQFRNNKQHGYGR